MLVLLVEKTWLYIGRQGAETAGKLGGREWAGKLGGKSWREKRAGEKQRERVSGKKGRERSSRAEGMAPKLVCVHMECTKVI